MDFLLYLTETTFHASVRVNGERNLTDQVVLSPSWQQIALAGKMVVTVSRGAVLAHWATSLPAADAAGHRLTYNDVISGQFGLNLYMRCPDTVIGSAVVVTNEPA